MFSTGTCEWAMMITWQTACKGRNTDVSVVSSGSAGCCWSSRRPGELMWIWCPTEGWMQWVTKMWSCDACQELNVESWAFCPYYKLLLFNDIRESSYFIGAFIHLCVLVKPLLARLRTHKHTRAHTKTHDGQGRPSSSGLHMDDETFHGELWGVSAWQGPPLR